MNIFHLENMIVGKQRNTCLNIILSFRNSLRHRRNVKYLKLQNNKYRKNNKQLGQTVLSLFSNC